MLSNSIHLNHSVEQDFADFRALVDKRMQILRAIPESICDALMIITNKGVIDQVNTEFEMLFGYARHEVNGKTPEMLIPERFRENHIKIRETFSEKPRKKHMADRKSLTAVHRDGTEFEVTIQLNPVTVPEGNYIIAIIRKS